MFVSVRIRGRGLDAQVYGRRVFVCDMSVVRLPLLVFGVTDADSCLLAFVYKSGVHNDRKRTRVTCPYTRRRFGLKGKKTCLHFL